MNLFGLINPTGHETTSSLLSFVFYNLIQQTEVFLEAREEIDRAVGSGRVQNADLKELIYVNAILREMLRLIPTVPFLGRELHPAPAPDSPLSAASSKCAHNSSFRTPTSNSRPPSSSWAVAPQSQTGSTPPSLTRGRRWERCRCIVLLARGRNMKGLTGASM